MEDAVVSLCWVSCLYPTYFCIYPVYGFRLRWVSCLYPTYFLCCYMTRRAPAGFEQVQQVGWVERQRNPTKSAGKSVGSPALYSTCIFYFLLHLSGVWLPTALGFVPLPNLLLLKNMSFPSSFVGNPFSQIRHDMDSRLRGNDSSSHGRSGCKVAFTPHPYHLPPVCKNM